MINVLITGVAGLLGSKLADWIITNKPDVKVIGIDDLSGGYIDNVHKDVIFHKDNILDDTFINQIFDKYKPTYVFHFAAYAAEGLSPFVRGFNYTNNLLTTAKLINQSIKHNVKRFVFTSSMSVYGSATPPFIESYRQNPIDPYGVAKYACEMDLQIAGEQHNLDWCIFRPHNVYGDKQNIWDKYRNVLGIWMYYHMHGQPITIYGDGTQKRAFSYIDDSLEPLYNACIEPKASKQIINLGGINEYSINEAAEILSDVLGGVDTVYLEKRHEVHTAVPTYQKSIDILGFEHRTDLKQGLSKMWEWAQEQPKRDRFIWPEYEIEKGIYNFWSKK